MKRARRAANPGLISFAVLVLAVCAPPASVAYAQAAGEDVADAVFYPVSNFELRYVREHPDLPETAELMSVPVRLGRVDEQTLVAPPRAEESVEYTLAELSDGIVRRYSARALQIILEALSGELSARDYAAFFVSPDPMQITEDGVDERPEQETSLRLIVVVGIVDEMRTLARRERIPEGEDRVNHPLHERLKTESPIQPGDVLRTEPQDEYAMLLSRHPGRRVDVVPSSAAELGGVTLDYIVTEVKPWLVYAQTSNTGTRHTGGWRQQFGFRHYQLTNNDDILAADYSTACFDRYNAVNVEYDSRLGSSNVLRWRIFGDWSRYTASDVGLFRDTFRGRTYRAGGEMRWNFYQDGPLFLDTGAGLRLEHHKVWDTIPGTPTGREALLIPYALLRVERATMAGTLQGSLTAEWQPYWLNRVGSADMAALGRAQPDTSWPRLLWDLSQSVQLQWLLDADAWHDVTTPETSTLAHELYFRTAGQTTFGRRVAPQHETAVGGVYTVRGYDQSVTAGDEVLMGTAEYRFHLPRALPLEPEPRTLFDDTFRFAPQQVYGPTDWNIIFRGFLDAAYVRRNSSDMISSDSDNLIGTGIGMEFQYRRNVTFRMDWGIALSEVGDRVSRGSSQLHFVITLLY